ncbi:hypothetical protein [Clostridioides difficile]|uniref:hypothetical protein n=1 Tax=Clostridioides difficile TaxID=1496 RepID=UPI0018AB6369|nr:hypothetical protein [Clostridioides difficile]MBF8988756.1 hypothetical protein [Clostridioides difficile]
MRKCLNILKRFQQNKTDKQVPKGRILNATISKEPSGRYYVSLCCTDVTGSTVGVLSNTIVNVPFVAFTVDTAATTSFASTLNAAAFVFSPL